MSRQGKHEAQSRARRRALQALYQWHMTGQPPNEIIAQFLEEQDFEAVDQALFEALVNGVASLVPELDDRLQPSLDRPWSQLDLMERIVLGLASYELLHRPDVPARVILAEAVDLAKRFGAEQGHRYVNGVLDRAARAWRPAELERENGAGN